ncbi:MAG: DUF1788 domain-containing protein [Methanothrix sp.]|nr:BREX protein BrxB domain-containing protein [Methanothrix sp.]MCX8207897.1 DUF1788 domain-containing protein [Methanothrix sp.]
MLSLKERIELLESDLTADPPRVSVYHDMPFAILWYRPADEWMMRREVNLLASRLRDHGKNVRMISLAELLWEAIDKSEGMDVLIELERSMGFEEAQRQVSTYLTDPDYMPLSDLLANQLIDLDPKKDVAFLIRAASMAPAIYPMSRLLNEMHGRTMVTIILFYPGTLEGTTGMPFMDLKDREVYGNYKVKIY